MRNIFSVFPALFIYFVHIWSIASYFIYSKRMHIDDTFLCLRIHIVDAFFACSHRWHDGCHLLFVFYVICIVISLFTNKKYFQAIYAIMLHNYLFCIFDVLHTMRLDLLLFWMIIICHYLKKMMMPCLHN